MHRLRSKIINVSQHRRRSNDKETPIAELIRQEVLSFPSVEEARVAIANRFDSFGSCKVLLIGDATHGTSEFYTARNEITKFMIESHGFNVVAVEADWPDAEAVDRYVRQRPGPAKQASVEPAKMAEIAGREQAFMRFPTWMWRNTEVHDFIEWLRDYNLNQDTHKTDSIGFYGLDLFSLGESMRAVIDYLQSIDEEMADVARDRYGGLMSWGDPKEYGLEALVSAFRGYEEEVVDMLQDLLSKRLEYSAEFWDSEEFHSGEQNARLVKSAEQYFKTMFYGRRESWNLREEHMFDTLLRILEHRGDDSKAIVWTHNSHAGDARATSQGWIRDEVNIGQLCKETYGSAGALSICCSTYKGTVAAAECWDRDMSIMRLRPALPGSYEQILHSTHIKNFVLDLREGKCTKELREALKEQRLERSIGIIYKPHTERESHYSVAVLPKQFDGLVWLDETRHVGALEVHQPPASMKGDKNCPYNL
ncbi:hypothetical protein M426DRAFT_265688 [Hypoxylon sp. CI-4A]|nr:hypothetical protein M426DRAFT_265688 [Hypoxylon sp. CI-4A]